ncbi:putative nuclease SbcCD subunit C [Candidatus Promineifilum breve]|uniref:Nuclease SbcCD subunit C n=1 Tax=Candidatus Promineifilum breve TaxID=1806508 RepID=A0A160T0B8_9CHLR|nr:SMC family ATPase [Candidatus Promineifilum breve]CUS02499.1 putative nuclease SbcCD subunit C [Candidatus Promineifilum breve]
MIPHHLTLRNFLSYRDAAELDLRGLQLACISGLNGAGKSTILDGITWALFGKSRVKSDDDVVNRAAGPKAAAEVSFIFELEGAIYRVIRRKAPGKTTELEFHAYLPGIEDGEGRWQVKTEARTRETQAEIERLLRMNYEVFTNASFLLQGKADEFTTKTPDKRKEILADILGVSIWDSYKEVATESRKRVEGEAAALERQLVEIDAELAREDELTRALAEAKARLTVAAAARDRQDALVTVARQNKAQADQQRQELRRVAGELAESEAERRRVEEAQAQRRAELSGHRSLLDRRAAIIAAHLEWQTAETDLRTWQEKAEAHNRLTQEMHPLQTAIANAHSRLAERAQELGGREERIKAEATRGAELRAQLTAIQVTREALQRQAAELAEQQQAWETTGARLRELEVERHKRETERQQLGTMASEMGHKEIERQQVRESHWAATAALEELRTQLTEMDSRRRELADKSAEIKGLETEQKRLRLEMDKIKDRLDKLLAESGQDCPLCGQPLTKDHRLNVQRDIEAEGAQHGDLYRRNSVALKTLTSEVGDLEKTLKQQSFLEKDRDTRQGIAARAEARLQDIEKSLAGWLASDGPARLAALEQAQADDGEWRELQTRHAGLKTAAEEARRVGRELNDHDQRAARHESQIEDIERRQAEWLASGLPALEDARVQLAAHSYAATERAALAELQGQLTAIGFDATAYAAARARRDERAAAPEEQQRLLRAEAAVKPLEDGLLELDRQRERLVKREVELRGHHEAGRARLVELEAGIGDLAAAEAELLRVREEAIAADKAVTAADQWVSVLAIRREDRRKLVAEKTALAQRAGLLRQLEEACGRKGVQVLLIERALPEIEEYANNLLENLSGGEMSITFDTQRQGKTKQDNLIETLDIKIADSTGERPYENYSGGEKFRVNFAIRLALSQVLARRAGARLRTLVIDEGFGSQDPDGRQKLVEAINAVHDEFACILVITHIDELRDKFPARIDVEKTAAGSRLSVVTI